MALLVPLPQALDGLIHPTQQKLPVLRQASLERKGVGLVRPIVDGRDLQQGQETPATAEIRLNGTRTPDLTIAQKGGRRFAPSSFILQKIRVSKYMRRRREGDI